MVYLATGRHGLDAARARSAIFDGDGSDLAASSGANERGASAREWRFPGLNIWPQRDLGRSRAARSGGSIADAVAHSMKTVSRL